MTKEQLTVAEQKRRTATPLVREALLQMEAKLNREWVGLTEDDLSDIAENCEWISDWRKVVNATEAKLKEKNA